MVEVEDSSGGEYLENQEWLEDERWESEQGCVRRTSERSKESEGWEGKWIGMEYNQTVSSSFISSSACLFGQLLGSYPL